MLSSPPATHSNRPDKASADESVELSTLPRRSEFWGGIWISLLMLFIYLLSYSGVPHAVDELSALSAAETQLLNGDWHVNQMEWDQSRTPPQNITGIDGNLYSKKGIGASLIAMPLLWIGKQWPGVGAVQLAFLTGALVTALAVYCFYLLTIKLAYSRQTAIWGAVALGIGTLLWPYARTLFGESLGALGLSMALAGAVAFRRSSLGRPGYAALLATGVGLAILTLAKSANAVVLLFFALYLLYAVLWEDRKHLAIGRLILQGLSVAIPVGIGVAVTVVYNYARFHTLLTFPLESFESFSTPILLGLLGLLASPGKGLLWYVPLTWLALLGLSRWTERQRLPDFLLGLASLLAPIALYALWYDWPGGRAWGPRMIVVTMPAVAMLALPALDALVEGTASRWQRRTTALLLGLSILMQLPGVLVNFEIREAFDMQAGVTFEQLLWHVEHSPLLTYWSSVILGPHDPWWLQPYTRTLALWQWVMLVAVASLSVLLLWLSGRTKSGRQRGGPAAGLAVAATVALVTFGLAIVFVSADDVRWHERTAEHADNLAVISLLNGEAGSGDLVLLDLLPDYDHNGRQWLWMNSGPADLPYLGWLRKETMDDATSAQLDAWLKSANRVWLALQETDQGDPRSTTEHWLDGWGYRGRQTWVGSQRVVEYLTAPTGGAWQRDPFSFENTLILNSYRIVPLVVDEGSAYAVDLDWDRLPAPALRFSLQALDEAGQLVAQIDRVPGRMDDFTDKIGLSTESLPQQIILKVYNADDGRVLPVRTATGDVSDYLTLTTGE